MNQGNVEKLSHEQALHLLKVTGQHLEAYMENFYALEERFRKFSVQHGSGFIGFIGETPLHRGHAEACVKFSKRAVQGECGSCDGFNSGCEECSGLGLDGQLAAFRELANVAHRVAHVMGLPAGFDVTTLPDVVAQRLKTKNQVISSGGESNV